MTAALRVLVAGGILALLVAQLGAGAVLDGLGSVGPGTVFAALGLGLLATGAMAVRWWLVARSIGAPLGTGAAVGDLYRAQLLNAVLPAGVLGDVHRAVRHARTGGPAGLRAVVLERVSGQSVVVLACAALMVVPSAPVPTGVGAAVAITAPALAWIRRPGEPGAGPGRHARQPGGRWRRALRSWLVDVRTVLASRRTGPAVVALSVTALACHLAMFVLAARTAGVDSSLGTLLPLLAAGLLAMSVPIGVGGWGPREGVTAGAFAAAGLDPAAGLAAAVVFGALALVSGLPGAVLLFRAPARPAGARIPAVQAPARVLATAEGRTA